MLDYRRWRQFAFQLVSSARPYAQFDLDLFMTSYDLWATQGSIRAADYNLAHSPVPHTVSALLLVWDDAELIADESGELTTALGSPGTRGASIVAA